MRSFVLARMPNEHRLVEAAWSMRKLGHEKLDAHSPYPLKDADEALNLKKTPVSTLVACGAFIGALVAYFGQWWCNAVDYPINVGGRPPHAPPTNIPITFELAILFGSLTAFVAVFILARLPKPYHPVFEVESFRSASIDALWLSVELDSPPDPEVRRALEAAGALEVSFVELPEGE